VDTATNPSSRGADDIRAQLRGDHDGYLAELESLRRERDAQRCLARLRELRRTWTIHALAEESVVYRALEGALAPAPQDPSSERFVEHELVEHLFARLASSRPNSLEWRARLNVARELIARHIETEHGEVFARLASRFRLDALEALGREFARERERLSRLEEAKAA
jgi:hemerythrin HHE cation binding domain-containing protein